MSFYIGIYTMIKVLQFVAIYGNCWSSFISMITFAGTVLHKAAITTVVTAPLKFFSTTDSGIVTNLFSQDMTLIDGELPASFTNVTLDMASVVGMLFVIASASPWLALGYPPLVGIVYILQKFYLRTSRQMRLLDLEAKSPL
jgi:ATP-binding cassette subfamily C (CFTR/MRP) protein 1